MSPRHAARARRRSWPQRSVLVAGVAMVSVCLMAAAAVAYLGLRYGQIDRVSDIDLQSAAAGEPANFLIVGSDSREGISVDDPDAGGFLGDGQSSSGGRRSDTIMLLRVDPSSTDAYLLSLPRDLLVPLAGGRGESRINSAYGEGRQVLIDTIEENLDLVVNHYVEIDFVGFEQLVDAVGGITLWFDAPLRDPQTGLQIDETGCVELDGEQARRFVRSRYLQYRDEDGRWRADPTADFGRMTRQQIFIRRAISKAVDKGLTNPVTLNQLVSAAVDNVSLDEGIDAGDLLSLGRRFASFDAEELQTFTLPTDRYFTSGGADVQLMRERDAEPILNLFRGLPPGTLSPGVIDVEVQNGTTVDGQAHDVAAALTEIGFHVVGTGNHPEPVGRTTVVYGDGGHDAARRVARHVTGGAALVHDDTVDDGRVVLVTGADLTTLHDQPAPEGSPDDLRSTTSTTPTTQATVPGSSATTTTSTTILGYATGEPPAGAQC